MDQDCNVRDCTSLAATSLSLAVSVCSMNKPDPAMVRPDRVSACIEFGIRHFTCDICGETDGPTDKTDEKAELLRGLRQTDEKTE